MTGPQASRLTVFHSFSIRVGLVDKVVEQLVQWGDLPRRKNGAG